MSRGGGRGWRLPGVDDSAVRALARRHRVDQLTAMVLVRRGVTVPVEVEAFLGRGVIPPVQIDGMEAAVERVCRCEGHQVYVFGDPNVDSIAATAILVEMLRRLGAWVRWRILPGGCHGVGVDDLHSAKETGAELIVCVDGAFRSPEAEEASRIGCDVLVVDHYPLVDDVTPSVLRLNPAIAACGGLNRLAAGTVALKLAGAVHQATAGRAGGIVFDAPYDLAALSTLADRVPLTGENRCITVRGLQMMAPSGRPGLLELWIRVGQSAPEPTADQVSRRMNPVIESAACYGEGDHAVELLVSQDRARCAELSDHLLDLNVRRRRDAEAAWNRLMPTARRRAREHPGGRCLVVDDQELTLGLTGALAYRLSRFLHRPVAVVAYDDCMISGSIRIPEDGADALQLLKQASDLLMKSGGHRSAGGFVAAKRVLSALRQRWSGLPGASGDANDRPQSDRVLDAEISACDLTPALDRLIAAFEPIGVGAGPLVFWTRGLQVADVGLVGYASEHCKLLLDSGAYRWPALYWGEGATAGGQITPGDVVDVVYRLEPSHADGERRLHMVVLDLCR